MTVFTPVTEVTWRQKTSAGHATLVHTPHSSTVRLGWDVAATFLSPALVQALVSCSLQSEAMVPTAFSRLTCSRGSPGPEHLPVGVLWDTRASSRGWSGLFRNISLYNGAQEGGGVKLSTKGSFYKPTLPPNSFFRVEDFLLHKILCRIFHWTHSFEPLFLIFYPIFVALFYFLQHETPNIFHNFQRSIYGVPSKQY